MGLCLSIPLCCYWGYLKLLESLFRASIPICSVLLIELTLHWNNVSGANDLASAGQLIPLVVSVGTVAQAIIMILINMLKLDGQNEAQGSEPGSGQEVTGESMSRGEHGGSVSERQDTRSQEGEEEANGGDENDEEALDEVSNETDSGGEVCDLPQATTTNSKDADASGSEALEGTHPTV